jgi:DNA replication licensing factor MCM5
MHVSEYDTELFNSLQSRPNDILPYFEAGAKDALNLFLQARNASEANEALFQDFQVILKSSQLPQSIRSLTSIHVNKLVKVPGIVISTSKAQSRPTFLTVRCKTCKHDKVLRDPHRTSVGGIPLPQKCDVDKNPTGDGVEGCGKDPYIIMPDDCEFFDQQLMKLQESPEVVPTGEMPRAIRIQVERRLVDMVTPGTRVSVMGVLSMSQRGSSSKYASAIAGGSRPLFLRVVGIEIDNTGTGRLSTNFTPAEEEAMQALARDPDIYEKLARSIAPQISGDYTKDLKKAIACLLMSGSRKTLPDGVKLRGDINVLLIGDPSTAKSQFLKFVERAAPIGVYTSGKGSSAAGLTASVIKVRHY